MPPVDWLEANPTAANGRRALMVSAFGRRAGGILAIVALAAAPRLSLRAEDDATADAGDSVVACADRLRARPLSRRRPARRRRRHELPRSTSAGVNGLSLGPAVYGAISGDHGGFFSLGGEVAWRQRLVGPVGVELGLYAGGGGGGGAPHGQRPDAEAARRPGLGPRRRRRRRVDLARCASPAARSTATRSACVVNINSDFRFIPAERLGEPTLGGGRAGLGFDRVQFVGGAYRTPEGKTLNDGSAVAANDQHPRRSRRALASPATRFWGLEANRAARGGVGGYAEYLGTAGFEGEAIRDVLTVGARAAVGMAGGGGVSTGGGLLVKGGVYGIVRLGNDLGLSLEGGYARAPDGNFRAAQGSIGLVWALDGPATSGPAAPPARTDFSAGGERYDAPRSDGSERALGAVALKLDRYLTPNFYISGKVLSRGQRRRERLHLGARRRGLDAAARLAPARRRRAARRGRRRRRRRRRRRAGRAARLRRRADHADARPARRRRADQGDRRPAEQQRLRPLAHARLRRLVGPLGSATRTRRRRSCTVRDFQEQTMADNTSNGDKPRALSPTTKRTGQKRSLERGKSTRKKNPGKRAHKGG